MLPTGSVGDRDAVFRYVWSFALQTPQNSCAEFVLHSLRKKDPCSADGMRKIGQSAIIFATIAEDASSEQRHSVLINITRTRNATQYKIHTSTPI